MRSPILRINLSNVIRGKFVIKEMALVFIIAIIIEITY